MRQSTHLQRQILRRTVAVLIVAFVVLAAVSIILLYNFLRADIQARNAQNVDTLAELAEREIRDISNELVRVATSSTMLEYARVISTVPNISVVLDNPTTVQRDTLRLFDDMIRRSGDRFLAVRYISRDGQVWAQATAGVNETIVAPVGAPGSLEIAPGLSEALTQARAGQPYFSAITAPTAGDPFLFLYVPVAALGSANNILGTTQLIVRVDPLESFFLTLLDNPLVAQSGRNILLVDSQNNILVDSSGGVLGGDAGIRAILDENRASFNVLPTGSRLISSRIIEGYAGQNIPWRLVMIDNRLDVVSYTLPLIGGLVALMALTFGLVAVLVNLLTGTLIRPLESISRAARRLVDDDQPESDDEVTDLQVAVERASHRLEALTASLENEVRRRNRDLQIASNIGREIATLYDIDTLLIRSINLIADELGHYHAQVFLVDDAGVNAVLVQSRGKAGQQLLEQGFKIPVGSQTVIGQVTATGRAVIVNDTMQEGVTHGFNPVLAETRAELGLPLMSKKTVIGVLDIQSKEPNAFTEDDMATYHLLADQLAVAIENARLINQSDQRIRQIDTLNRQLTRSAWEEAGEDIGFNRAYRYNLLEISAEDAPTNGNLHNERPLNAPITIRGETIGEIAAVSGEDHDFTDGDTVIVQAIASRVALAIENARLFRETQTSLTETSTLYQLSRYLNESNTLEDILQSIIVSAMPDATSGQVWMFDEYERGDDPEWMMLRTDFVAVSRESREKNLTSFRLRVEDHPFLYTLPGDRVTLIYDTRNDARMDSGLKLVFRRLGAESIVMIPLVVRGQWRGVITVGFPEPRQFSERESRIYAALSDQAGVAIDNRLLLQQTEQEVARNENLYAASRIINTADSMQELVRAAVATADDKSLRFSLSLLEPPLDETGWPSQARTVARSQEISVLEVNEVFPFEVASDSPMRNREPEIIIDDIPRNADVTPRVLWIRDQGYRFVAMFPLFSANQPIAIFQIASPHLRDLSPADYETYRALTGQMSSQIQIRKLLERTEAALEETRRLYVASRVLTSADDFASIYYAAVEHLAYPFGDVTDRNVEIALMIATPQSKPSADYLDVVIRWRSGEGLIDTTERLNNADYPFAAMTQIDDDGILLFDVAQPRIDGIFAENPAWRGRLIDLDIISAAVAPVRRSQSRWFGVLVCTSDQPETFDESYLRFLTALADQVAIAIDNRRLFQQTQEEQRYLRTILETLPAGVLVLNPQTFEPIQYNQQLSDLIGDEIDLDRPFSIKGYKMYRTGTDIPYPRDEMPIYVALEESVMAWTDDIAIELEHGRVELLANAAPIMDDDGNASLLVVAFQDITNLRKLEQNLYDNLRETVSLYEAQSRLAEAGGFDDVLNVLVMHLFVQKPAETYIVLMDAAGGLSVARSMATTPDDPEILRPLLDDHAPVTINNVAKADLDPDLKALLKRLGAGSVVALPFNVTMRDLPLGWMIVAYHDAQAANADQLRVLTQLRDSTATALDNRLLIESQAATVREVESLYSVTAAIARARDINALEAVLQDAVGVLSPDYAYAFLDSNTGLDVGDVVLADVRPEGAPAIDFRTILDDYDIDIGGLYINDITRINQLEPAEEQLLAAGIVAFAAIALRPRDVTNGLIVVAYRAPHTFTEAENRYLNTLADGSSVVINTFALFDQIQSSLEESIILYQASRALADARTPEDVLRIAIDYLLTSEINQAFIALSGSLTWDAKDSYAIIESSWENGNYKQSKGYEVNAETFPAWRQVGQPTPVTINDVRTESDLSDEERQALEAYDVRSMVAIPLRTSQRNIGVVWLASNQPHEHTDREARSYQVFGEQASLSLEAAYLLEQAERNARQLQTSAEVSQNAAQILDLEELFPRLVNLIQNAFGYDHVQIFLMSEDERYAELRASTGPAGQKLLMFRHKLEKGSNSVIGMVTASGEPQIALDTTDAEVAHRPNPYLPDTRSEMALPLIIKGRVVGALDVQSNQPNAFKDEDVKVLTTLAAQISVAIDNANLYESAQTQAGRMQFLFEITAAAAVAESLDETLQRVVDEIRNMFDSLAVVAYLPKSYVNEMKKDAPEVVYLEAVVLAGGGQPLSEIESIKIDDETKLLAQIARNKQPYIIDRPQETPNYLPISAEAKSGVILPLVSGGKLIGLLVIEDRVADAYGYDTIQLLLALSGSLSSIVQSTQLLEQLQATNEQLLELDRIKSSFLANMSHELRTPLNSIIGFSRVMLKGIDGPLTEMQEQDLTTIYNSGQHLLMLINDILDQAKIAAEQLDLKFSLFEIKPLIDGVKSIAIGLIKDKQIDLRVEIAPNMPTVYGDEFRTRQILLNLVSNAAKFTNEGHISIRAYAIEMEDKTPMVRVDVEDTGIGIDAKDIPLLFEAFRQVDSSLTRTAGGTGLGLPIAKSLTELQGGEMVVQSEVNVGSVFSVTIPVAPVEEITDDSPDKSANGHEAAAIEDDTLVPEKDDTHYPVSSDSTKPDRRKKTSTVEAAALGTASRKVEQNRREVLLIEDNKDMVDQFRRTLQREGFKVQTADHPSYAEAMVSNLRPNVIVMDVDFAEGEGWNILKRLKDRDDTFDIPVIVVTLNAESERAYTLGAHTFIRRPFDPETLVQAAVQAERESNVERILIIDDQPDAVRLLTQLLNEHGTYRVFSAGNGIEGISLVARRRPDLIILDLRMPDMDGFAVLEELRNNPETSGIPVLVVTGDLDLKADEQAQLTNIRVLHKTDISEAEFRAFISDVRDHLQDDE